MIRVCFTVIMILFALCTRAQSERTSMYRLEKDNRPVRINCLYKRDNGYLLVGTDQGLYRFDGLRFYPMPFQNRDYSDTVTAIIEDTLHHIWAGFKSGRLARYDHQYLHYINPEEGTPAKRITSFARDSSGRLWFGSAGEGLYYFDQSKMYLVNAEDGLSDGQVNALQVLSDGQVIAGTDQGLAICKLNRQKRTVRTFTTKDGLPDQLITSLAVAMNGWCWIGMQDKGICLYDPVHEKILQPEGLSNWAYGEVTALHASGNILMIGTRDHGFFLYNADTDYLETLVGNTPVTQVSGITRDDQGNHWIATPANGLIRTQLASFHLIPAPGNPVFEHVHALLSDSRGRLWINNERNELVRTDDPRNPSVFTRIRLEGLTDKTDITALYEDGRGYIWIGTMGRGLFLLDPSNNQYRRFTEYPGFESASVLSISGSKQEVYVSSLEGAISIQAGQLGIHNSHAYTKFDSRHIGTNYIYAVFRDSKNRVWFGTDGDGLVSFDGKKYEVIDNRVGLSDEHVFSITEDQLGNIWFSTAKSGVYRYDGKHLEKFDLNKGLSDIHVSAVRAVASGHIMVVNRAGIDIIDQKTGRVSYLGIRQGLGEVNAEDLGAVSLGRDGALYVSTTNGILQYRVPEAVSQQPKPVIESVQLFLSDIPLTRREFAYDENNLTFYYTGLYYTDPERVFYQYKLEGLDSNWVNTTDRFKNFPRLQPGNYVFRVRASLNRNFDYANEASFAFRIRKPFYREYWFIGLSALLLSALLYAIIRNREAAVKRMERLKQEKIEQQFAVLRTQVNPHFLFNSFNTLISTIEEDPQGAVGYAEQLSDFFRQIIQYRDHDTIPLSDEVNLLNLYHQLQQRRFGDPLKLDIRISDAQMSLYRIPPLTLQLLVENAIKHNVVTREKPLTITLEIVQDEDLLLSNNINPRMSKQPGAGMGLQNIMSRYNLLSRKKVRIEQKPDTFTVSLPLLKA